MADAQPPAAPACLPAASTMMETIGYRLLEADPEHAIGALDFQPAVAQLTGLFHAGALFALADTTATYLCLQNVYRNGVIDDPARFPLTIQFSANLVRNTNAGTATAEARLRHRGRTTLVAETTVRDGRGRTLVIVTTTHLVLGDGAPSAPPC